MRDFASWSQASSEPETDLPSQPPQCVPCTPMLDHCWRTRRYLKRQMANMAPIGRQPTDNQTVPVRRSLSDSSLSSSDSEPQVVPVTPRAAAYHRCTKIVDVAPEQSAALRQNRLSLTRRRTGLPMQPHRPIEGLIDNYRGTERLVREADEASAIFDFSDMDVEQSATEAWPLWPTEERAAPYPGTAVHVARPLEQESQARFQSGDTDPAYDIFRFSPETVQDKDWLFQGYGLEE